MREEKLGREKGHMKSHDFGLQGKNRAFAHVFGKQRNLFFAWLCSVCVSHTFARAKRSYELPKCIKSCCEREKVARNNDCERRTSIFATTDHELSIKEFCYCDEQEPKYVAHESFPRLKSAIKNFWAKEEVCSFWGLFKG